MPANGNNAVLELNQSQPSSFIPAVKNHHCGLRDSEDEFNAKIVSVPDFETG